MSKLAIRAEIIKLARLYRVEESTLGFLESLSVEHLHHFRDAAQEKLFGDDLTLFQRLAKASVLLPAAMLAMLSQKVFGPILSARVAGEMSTRRAVDLAMRMPVNFLADIALELDPKRAKDIIGNITPERVREVAEALIQRQEFVTMGRFVDYLSEAAIRECIKAFHKEADLLHVGFFIENKTRLNALIRMLPDAQLKAVIISAQDETQDLWSEALALMTFVDDGLKRKLGDLAAEQDPAVLLGLADTAQKQGLWGDVLPMVACMSELSQHKLVALPVLADRAAMTGILHAADEDRLWPALLPLVRMMSPSQKVLVSEIAAGQPERVLEGLAQAAQDHRLWGDVLPMVAAMSDEGQNRMMTLPLMKNPAIIQSIMAATQVDDLWTIVLPLVQQMGEPQRLLIAELTGMRAAIAQPAPVEITASAPGGTKPSRAG